ncbi:efflux RND transporter periplasmic adaptor subunit [Petrocella sp. FN5]|uniref:efflux RND transporter periplasmic adaptor subunit n=1 Tax=Petrocella sp. FN5 TaxID=3032002 RepID=UPI0023DA5C1D|nr:efflux RND transporter periplasmic adaptor subunit [Petrocella sp. FN5]MDF1617851.1 efflux RND transporter periplasmic adaptor subunit [Petrocella sp. FN5]
MKKYSLVITVLLISTIIFTGCQGESEVIGAEGETYTPVKVSTIVTGNMREESVFTGQVKPVKEIDIMGKFPGEINAIYFSVGESVSQGDILFTFNETDMRHTVESLASQMNSAEAAVNSAKLNVNITSGSQQESQLNQVKSSLNSAKLTYDNAKINFDNTQTLYTSGAVSKSEYDGMEQAYLQAKNAYDTVRQSYDLLTGKQLYERTELAKNGLQQAIASRDALVVQYNNAKETLSDLNVSSPISGIIATKNIETGEIYNSSFPAYSVIGMDTIIIPINVTDDLINVLTIGDVVYVTIQSISGEEYTGKITEISPIPNDMDFTYPVKVEVSNANHQIKPGMFAEVRIIKNQVNDIIVVNRSHLERIEDTWYAYVVENDMTHVRPVKLGLDNGKEVEIMEGLKAGDLLIVSGKEYVSDQEKVTIVE